MGEGNQGGGPSHVELPFQLAGARRELDTLEGDFKTAEANAAALEGETIPQLKQVVSEKQKAVNAANTNVRQLTAEIEKLDAKHAELAQRLKEFFKAGEELRDTIEKKAKQTARVRSASPTSVRSWVRSTSPSTPPARAFRWRRRGSTS